MAKFLNDDVLDAGHDEIRDNANLLCVCSAQPTTRAEAASTYALATVSIDSGDMTKADGFASGRKLTIAEQLNVPITTGGTATHVAIVSNTVLYAVVTIVSQALVLGNLVNIPTWTITFPDPI